MVVLFLYQVRLVVEWGVVTTLARDRRGYRIVYGAGMDGMGCHGGPMHQGPRPKESPWGGVWFVDAPLNSGGLILEGATGG